MSPGGRKGAAGSGGFEPRPYRSAWWLPGAHAQTIAGRLLRRPAPPQLTRERLELADGDFVDLDFAPAPRAGAPAVLLLHGLEGSARRGYALITYAALARRGLRAVGMNFRSCSGEPNRTARLYHSGETDDLRHVLAHLRVRLGAPAAGAIGFSLGGNVLLKYLGEEGEAAPVRAAVAVSVPYDLAAGVRALERSFMGRFYTRIFVKSLVAKALAKSDLIADRCDLERVRAARSFWDFDDAATAPLHGFRDAGDYYERSSSARFLARIRVPTLLLHARDDPFLPEHAVPFAAIRANPRITAAITRRGGHVGFLGGRPWAPTFWAEEEAARFLAGVLDAPAPPR
jgi:predicted alpha/beta-fold hydrolase